MVKVQETRRRIVPFGEVIAQALDNGLRKNATDTRDLLQEIFQASGISDSVHVSVKGNDEVVIFPRTEEGRQKTVKLAEKHKDLARGDYGYILCYTFGRDMDPVFVRIS